MQIRRSSGLVLALLVCAPLAAGAKPIGQRTLRNARALGVMTLNRAVRAAAPAPVRDGMRESTREQRHREAVDAFAQRSRARNKAAAAAAAQLQIPHVKGFPLASGNHDASGFFGISNYASAGVNGGYSSEPPDQALCAGNGFVMEGVNNALTVYDEQGRLAAGPADTNTFFGQLPESDPDSTATSDPRCLYDAQSDRWFVTMLEYPYDFSSSAIMIAVSQNGDPTGNFVLYAIDVSKDADFPPKLDCPCLGDQPLIGADANGFYVSTNAFGARYFGGAQVYAFSKSALANHASSITYALFNHLSDYLPDIEFSFSIQPSFTPPGDPGEPGTEYFVQAMRATTLEQRIAVWSLGNTAALDTDFDLVLDLAVLPSQTYAYPVPAAQKAGPTPLAERAATQDFAYAANEQLLDGNDHRMQQVMFARGKLWTAVGTALVSPGSPVRDGAAWFVVEVKNPSTGLQARIASQGYVAGPDSSHLIYPALAVNQHGRAAMVFTLTGPQFYPSAAYWNFGGRSIHVLEDGVLPQDGFSAYYYARPRWGDYSAAAVGSDGSIWMATELIPPGPRKNAANWGTFVGRVGDDDHHDDD